MPAGAVKPKALPHTTAGNSRTTCPEPLPPRRRSIPRPPRSPVADQSGFTQASLPPEPPHTSSAAPRSSSSLRATQPVTRTTHPALQIRVPAAVSLPLKLRSVTFPGQTESLELISVHRQGLGVSLPHLRCWPWNGLAFHLSLGVKCHQVSMSRTWGLRCWEGKLSSLKKNFFFFL